MRVYVTDDDILNEKRGVAYNDPIARAIRRAIGRYKSVAVGARTLEIDAKDYPLSEVVRQFVNAFDRGLPVYPIEFEIPYDI